MTQIKQTTKRKGISQAKPEEVAHYQHPDHIKILSVVLSNIVPRIQYSPVGIIGMSRSNPCGQADKQVELIAISSCLPRSIT